MDKDMNFRNVNFLILVLVLSSFVLGIVFYPQMPNFIASHWGINGEVNGFMPKFWGLFLMPIISSVLYGFLLLIPKIDPLKENIKKFQSYFNGFIFSVIAFLFYLYLLTILWNLGYEFEMIRFLSPAFGILIFLSGVLIEHSKRNWFVGIRTPWTLSSDTIWNKTHKLGGKLFKASGLIAFLGLLLPNLAIFLFLIPLLFSVLYTTIYSYFEYRQNE